MDPVLCRLTSAPSGRVGDITLTARTACFLNYWINFNTAQPPGPSSSTPTPDTNTNPAAFIAPHLIPSATTWELPLPSVRASPSAALPCSATWQPKRRFKHRWHEHWCQRSSSPCRSGGWRRSRTRQHPLVSLIPALLDAVDEGAGDSSADDRLVALSSASRLLRFRAPSFCPCWPGDSSGHAAVGSGSRRGVPDSLFKWSLS